MSSPNILDVIIVLLILAYPFVMTFINVRKFFGKTDYPEILLDIFGLYPGAVLSCFSFLIMGGATGEIAAGDYNVPIRADSYHNFLHSEYEWIIVTAIILGFMGLTLLGLLKPEKTPPLIAAGAIACTVLGLTAILFLFIQLAKHFEWIHIFCLLYLANVFLLAVRRIRLHITERVRLANERETVYRTRFGAWLGKIMSKVSTMTLLSFVMIFPVAAILEILSIIFGQGPDGFIKAFTMTADWTFSTQIPPPPLEYDGHYLCTVAAGGHKKIVKPLRFGNRLDHKIVVNRQLLAANAFEDLIMEKLPRFHKAVRGFYNKYGYPVSRHITTPFRADVVYFLMKPLEYIFVFVLYLFDSQPENRIAVQYSNYKRRN